MNFANKYFNDAQDWATVNPYSNSSKEESLMSLLPDGMKAQLPALYENEALGLSAFAKVKFFTPKGDWTWYASEFDGVDIFFGLVIGFEVELGYFSLSELESLNRPNEVPLIERDLYFKETPLLELRDHYQKNGWAL